MAASLLSKESGMPSVEEIQFNIIATKRKTSANLI